MVQLYNGHPLEIRLKKLATTYEVEYTGGAEDFSMGSRGKRLWYRRR